ncbi:MAG: hypothetical protein KC431_17950, partial [Myxococcales bacterium]|nr:hypothetical protein [Myxococcales bacterium]
MTHGCAQTRRRRGTIAEPQGPHEGRLDPLGDDHVEASLTRCTTFVNLEAVFVQTLDTLVDGR